MVAGNFSLTGYMALINNMYIMPKRSSIKKRVRGKDENVLAKSVVNSNIEETEAKEEEKPNKNPAAVALGRLGGLKGGKARAKKLTAKQRSDIAKKAAEARWSREKK